MIDLMSLTFLVAIFCSVLVAAGIIVQVSLPPKSETPRQKRWDKISVIMILSIFWIGLPYLGLVFMPALGIPLWFSIIAVAVVGIIVAIIFAADS